MLDEPQLTVHEQPVFLRQFQLLEPRQPGLDEQNAHRRLDQPLGQQAVDAVLDPGPVIDQVGPVPGQPPHVLRGGIRFPNHRQLVAAQELRQHDGVQLVRLDLRLGDGPRLERVAHHHTPDVRTEQLDHTPGVGRGFQHHLIFAA